jgi:hypothetical protein
MWWLNWPSSTMHKDNWLSSVNVPDVEDSRLPIADLDEIKHSQLIWRWEGKLKQQLSHRRGRRQRLPAGSSFRLTAARHLRERDIVGSLDLANIRCPINILAT